ncbi:MAG: hypothetical protein IIB65_06670, partial [Proteobacteria bacterium]|nr:hypothetical protein [Pseudomonadota bacterium]
MNAVTREKNVSGIDIAAMAREFIPDFEYRDMEVTGLGPLYQFRRKDPPGSIQLQVG